MMVDDTIQQLIIQLETKATGANVHTAAKAAYYLRHYAGKMKNSGAFIELVRSAVYRGEWEALSDRMARWY